MKTVEDVLVGETAAKLRNVSFAFANPQTGALTSIFQGFNLSIRRGEILALLGSSGTGKSTLARLIFGELKATSGGVELASEFNRGIDCFYLDQDPNAVLFP